MSTYSSNLRLLDEITASVIKRHEITKEEVEQPMGYEGRVMRVAYIKASCLAPETLGRLICAFPEANLYSWHCGSWLGKYESGPYLLRQIVATVIICRMRYQLGLPRLATADYAPHQMGPVEMFASTAGNID
jgi:hypothetical protein